jgi:hypothetical protein
MAQVRETLTAKVKRLERENRVFREREQDFEERYQGPADIEGIGGRPSVLVYRDKNMGEFKKVLYGFPDVPALHSDPNDPTSKPIGYLAGVRYVRTEGIKMLFGLMIVPSHNTVLVRARHRVMMFVANRAGRLIRPRDDVIGQAVRAEAFAMAVREFFGPSVPYLAGISQETEVQPGEAERKGFG